MILNSEAPWVFDKSPHTGRPKTMHCIPVEDYHLMLCKPSGEIVTIESGTRDIVRLNGTYCVKSEQRAPALGCIKVECIRYWENVRLSNRHVAAIGYDWTRDFLEVWAHRHDTKFYDRHFLRKELGNAAFWELLRSRPDNLYTAWAITFAPVP